MNRLGIFAKHWTPGFVKTRLAADVGDRGASHLHRQFVATLLARFADFGDDRTLAFWPPSKQEDFQLVAGDDWDVWPQPPGDLGARMQAFFA